jgi:hypothetical protein
VSAPPRPVWGADVPISMPLPTGDQILVPMQGFGMSGMRLVHDLTAADYEDLSVPVYAPPRPGGSISYDDAGIDAAAGP